MEDKQYQGLEKKFHQLQENYLKQISTENDVPYGSAGVICKAIVEREGIEKAAEILESFQTTNDVELITSAYFDAEDLDKSDLPIPVVFVDIPALYSPGQSLECRLEIDAEFTTNISRRDWIGLFEVGWKYLHSYITFEWVSTTQKNEEEKHIMVVKFNSKTLPAKPKDEGHVFCYVTRTGDVLGVSAPFHFKNPGISFTDPDTFLVEDDMLTSINQVSIDMPSLSSPEEEILSPTFEEEAESRDSHLILSLKTLEEDLEKSRVEVEEKEDQIRELEGEVSQLKTVVAAKSQQQETVETDHYESLRTLERELTEHKIAKQQILSLNKDLEEKLSAYTATIKTQELDIQNSRKQLTDSEGIVNNLQEEIFQKAESSNEDEKVVERCRTLNQQKIALEKALDSLMQEKAELANHKTTSLEELHKVKMLVKSKDDVIDKLVVHKREADGTVVTLQSEANQHKDEAKRLLTEMNSCIKQLKESETEVYNMQKKMRLLESDKSELTMFKNESTTLRQKVQRLEQRNKDLESVKITLADSEIATVTVLSLQARIAHLEHQNSQYESQLVSAQISLTESMEDTTLSGDVVEENKRIRAELDIKTKQLDSIGKRAEEIEINFREGIKDLRGQLVKKSLEIEQKNESLADKGEIIDGLRAECQDRRETERYVKHRIAQLEKKLQEEAESYHQIISDLQSQLSGYTNAHIQFERHGLVKCPFCPAAYERAMQQQMEQHIQAKHRE